MSSSSGTLHLERHLVLRDARLNLGVVNGSVVKAVQIVDGVNRIVLHLVANAARARNIQDGVADRVEPHAVATEKLRSCCGG
jgi:hypothetical protein